LILSLQKFIEVHHGRIVKFLSDVKFKLISDTLDAVMKRSANRGVGLNTRQAAIISEEIENIHWEKKLLGDSDPGTLLDTTVYVLGLNFTQCGRQDHRRLRHKPFQISLQVDSNGHHFLQHQEVCTFISFIGVNILFRVKSYIYILSSVVLYLFQ